MRKHYLHKAVLVLVIFVTLIGAAQARDRVSVGIGVGGGPCWGPRYYYDGLYAYYPPPVYVVPPHVYYGQPPAVRIPSPPLAPVVNVSLVRVQDALRTRKYYQGIVDGVNGPQTEAAIRAYQTDRGLPITGRIDTVLLADLGL